MTRTICLGAALAAALGLAACDEAAMNSNPVYIERMVDVTEETASNMIGVWEGPFTPRDGKGEGGYARMEVTEVDGTLMRGHMTWTRDGKVWHEENFTAALTRTGHYMFLSTHVMVHRKGPEHFIVADVLMKDGNVYLHHLSRDGVSFEPA